MDEASQTILSYDKYSAHFKIIVNFFRGTKSENSTFIEIYLKQV